MKEQEAGRVYERVPVQVGSVLDVGCGVGDFLDTHFRKWDRHGVEISDYAAKIAKGKGIHVVPDSEYLGGSYDLVIWRGTFQHLDEPTRALMDCVERMKPGAMICFLATPNSNSPYYQAFGTLPALDDPRNFVIPSDLMLVNILRNLELVNIEVLYPYVGTPYAQPLNDFCKFILGLFGMRSKFAFPHSMMEVYAYKPL